MATSEIPPRSLGRVSIVRERADAVLAQFEDDSERWIPKSVIHMSSEAWAVHAPNDEGELVVDASWAEQQDWT